MDATTTSSSDGDDPPPPAPTPLALCVVRGDVAGVRALLQAGHMANERQFVWRDSDRWQAAPAAGNQGLGAPAPPWVKLSHVALAPPRAVDGVARLASRLDALEVLVHEGHLNINAADSEGDSCLAWLAVVERGRAEAALARLLALGADVGGGEGAPPLVAFLRGRDRDDYLPCVRRMVEAGAKVSGVDAADPVDGVFPLFAAAEAGLADVVDLLRDEGADPNERHPGTRQTALFAAAKTESARTVKRLLKRGASPNVVDNQGNTPLMVACGGGFPHDATVARWLFVASSAATRLATRPSDGHNALDCAVVALLEWRADSDSYEENSCPLYALVPGTHKKFLIRLLKEGLQLSADVAAHAGADVLPLAVEAGAPLGSLRLKRRSIIFRFLAKCDKLESSRIVPCLRALGVPAKPVFDSKGRAPLEIAASHRIVSAVDFLLNEAHVPVDEPNPKTGDTALHACFLDAASVEYERRYEFRKRRRSRAPVVALLLRAGADKDKRDAKGFTPLLLSIRGEDPKATAVLLEHKADANLVGPEKEVQGGGVLPGSRETALFLAARAAWHRFPAVFDELVRCSSTETIKRRVVDEWAQAMAYDYGEGLDEDGRLIGRDPYDVLLDRWGQGQNTGGDADENLVRQLLVLGPHFERGMHFLRRVTRSHGLKFAVERLFPGEAAAKAKLAELRAESNRWRAHDDIVQLVFDFRELREAEAAVAARERRVEELKAQLRANGASTDTESDEEEEEEDAEMGEADEAPSGGSSDDGEGK